MVRRKRSPKNRTIATYLSKNTTDRLFYLIKTPVSFVFCHSEPSAKKALNAAQPPHNSKFLIIMTLSQKILSAHCGGSAVAPSQMIMADVDLSLGNDITSPVAIKAFSESGGKAVHDPEKVAIVLDHFAPNKDIESARQCAACRAFAAEQGIKNFFDVGQMGIEHALLPEKGLALPEMLIVGADSHTCTSGALGCFSTGVGSTDLAYSLKTGKLWFRVPQAIKVTLEGALAHNVSGKDVILDLIGKIGVSGARYASLEFFGNVSALSMDDRFTVCNMAIEAGAKNGIFPVDDVTLEYVKSRTNKRFEKTDTSGVRADEYEREIIIDLSKLKPTIARPHLPENTVTLDEIAKEKIKIDQAVIGSCTNGRLSDIKAAYEVIKGKKIARGVRCIVIPATQEVYLQALRLGYIEALIEAGAAVSTPTCGPCLGGHMGILSDGEVAIATTNRNFIGRMGSKTSKIYLASPYSAARAAISGYIG